jgi:hypothetical protein
MARHIFFRVKMVGDSGGVTAMVSLLSGEQSI